MILYMNKGLDKWDLCFVIYMFLSNNPSSGDINSSNFVLLVKLLPETKITKWLTKITKWYYTKGGLIGLPFSNFLFSVK